MDRRKRPSALPPTPGLPPQPTVTISDDSSTITASLATGESVTVLRHGATVTSWCDYLGREKLWLSTAACLDGSKPVRGGIPLVFPVFGPPPPASERPETARLAQHGFARTVPWEFLGKSTTSEGGRYGGDAVTLDFGLSAAAGTETATVEAIRAVWPYVFSMVYRVTLSREGLTTTLVVNNDGKEAFEFQVLLHTYLKVDDITTTSIAGLDAAPYIDQLDSANPNKTQSGPVTFSGETDRIYSPPQGSEQVLEVLSMAQAAATPSENPFDQLQEPHTVVTLTRKNLDDAVVWNPWTEKAARTGDFEPKDGWRQMVCVEAGSVRKWQRLEPGEVFEGSQTLEA